MSTKFIQGKDCSEYAEDWIRENGCGELMTIMLFNRFTGKVEKFKLRNVLAGTVEEYYYHTFVLSAAWGVVDVITSGKETGMPNYFNRILEEAKPLEDKVVMVLVDKQPKLLYSRQEAIEYGFYELKLPNRLGGLTKEFSKS